MIDELPFEEIWLFDFEFITKPGGWPDVVCLCAKELRTGRTLRLWRTDLKSTPPYRTDDKVLFVCFAVTAECACHFALGWPLPQKIFDLSPVFRCWINGRTPPAEGKGLIGALAHFHLDSVGAKFKESMRKRILEGWPFSEEEQEKILDYCASDHAALELLLPKLLPCVELETALFWGEFAAVSAVMEHRGLPVDMEVLPLLQDKHAWNFVRDALVPEIDKQYGVFVQDAAGEWHFNRAKFEQCCDRLGIDWPRHDNGKLDLRQKTQETMCKSHPELEPLRQLKYARDKMRRVKIAAGVDGRTRTVLWPFQSKTSRSQPKASTWIFSPAVWIRSLVKPGPGRAIAYIDWSSMEFYVAAAHSKCQPMLDLYATGSPYVEFAKRFDAAPNDATKKTHPNVHERYKVGLLGAQYAMQYVTLARRLGVSTFVAHEMLNQHHGLFNAYWAWVEDWIAHAFDTGEMRTSFGWRMCTGVTEFNARSIGNWPTQSAGADILRVACVWAHRRGVQLIGSVHDAVVIEAPIDRIEADVALMQEIMRRASRVVLNADANGPYELRTDATIVRYPDRYMDKRGVEMWTRALELLGQFTKQKRRTA